MADNISPILQKSIILLLTIVSLTLISESIYAKSVTDSMEQFWDDMGGYSNGTEAGAYQTQGSGYYTAGGFRARSRVIDVNPVTITPPGIRAGCGGIDIYTGAFSHINTDQFVALAKAIPSNAIGFAFELALETVSPAIKGTVDQLQSIIDRVNSTNLNSCDLAQGLVGGGLAMAGKTKAYCATTANSQGWANDFARSQAECGTGGKSSQYIKEADSVHGDQRPVNINIAWEVLKKSNLINSGTNDNLAEFIQSITGTIIIKSPINDNQGPEIIYHPNIILKDETINAILDGGEVTILSCDEKDKCLNPTTKKINLPADKSFRRRVSNAMLEIAAKIRDGQKLEAKQQDLITKTSIPIYRMMLANQAYFKSSAANNLSSEYYSSLVAIDMLYNYFDQMLKQVTEQSKQISNFDQSNIDKFVSGLEKAHAELVKFKDERKDSWQKVEQMITSTRQIEEMLSTQMSSQMKNNLLWSSKF